MSWLITSTRKAIKFYHETDLDNLYSIILQGIKPSGGALGMDDFGRAEMQFYGAYFGKDEQSTSHGYETKINRKMVLQGWLPIPFVQKHGEADADYIYRMQNYYSSNFYPNAEYDKEDETTHEMNPETKQWQKTQDPHSWDKSYWQKPYGAAAVKKTVPFAWVENIKIGKRWFPKNEAVNLLQKELSRQKTEFESDMLRSWRNWDKQNKIFRISEQFSPAFPEHIEKAENYLNNLHSEYLTIKNLLTPEEIQTTEALFNMKFRTLERAKQESAKYKQQMEKYRQEQAAIFK